MIANMEDIRDRLKKPRPQKPHNKKTSTRPSQPYISATESAPQSEQVETIVMLPEKGPKASVQEHIKKLKTWWSKQTKSRKIIIVTGMSGLLIGAGAMTAWLMHPEPEPETAPVIVREEPESEPEPTTVPSPLTGMQVKPDLAELPVTAVIIENSPEARPQSGLGEAGVVFEAMVEGSITRFLALYQEQKPDEIGPIRSVRRNHIDWLQGFNAAVAHVGGSPIALSRIRDRNVPDLDQFQHSEAYWRSNNRFAPHNMYSSRERLLKVHEKIGHNESDFTGFARKKAEPNATPSVTSVDVQISGPMYNVRFDYDIESNAYKRFMGGTPHIDQLTNEQITSDIVIILVANYSRDGIYSVYESVGNGTAYIFQDGALTKGSWEKRNNQENIRFGDKNGLPIGINPGNTWITLATNENQISVKP